MENNEIMYEEVTTMEEPEVEVTEKKDLSGLITFAAGVGAAFATKYVVKGVKKLAKKVKDKKASKGTVEGEVVEVKDSED